MCVSVELLLIPWRVRCGLRLALYAALACGCAFGWLERRGVGSCLACLVPKHHSACISVTDLLG